MASITLAGTLLDPNSDLSVGDEIRFTHNSTTGQTVKGAVSLVSIPPNGTYSVPLQYGLVLVEYKDIRSTHFKNLGVATVNSNNPATTIPELLNALVPVSSAELIQFQAILADAVTAKNAAEAALAAIPTYGTAATANVTTSPVDTTADRLLKVGDFGIGGGAPSYSDWDAIPQYVNGMIAVASGATNRPTGLNDAFYHVVKFGDGNESFLIKSVNSGNIYIASRFNSGITWNVHGLIFQSGSFNYLQNTSGSTSASNTTVGGASLTPAQTGTWRNFSGGDILDNGYGLWSRV